MAANGVATAEAKTKKAPPKAAKVKTTAVKAEPRAKFGTDIRITGLPAENPRRQGTANFNRFKELQAFMKKKPQATVAEAIAGTTYRRNDFEWDLKREVFKTARA